MILLPERGFFAVEESLGCSYEPGKTARLDLIEDARFADENQLPGN